eukprot:7477494-Ditylum_brightwellii.AAC.1
MCLDRRVIRGSSKVANLQAGLLSSQMVMWMVSFSLAKCKKEATSSIRSLRGRSSQQDVDKAMYSASMVL